MKKTILLLVLLPLAFAQAQPLAGALTNLCETSKAFLGITIMLAVLATIPLLAIGFALYKIIKTENKAIRLAGMALLALGALAALAALIGAVIYVAAPGLIQGLLAPGAPTVNC